MHANRFLPGFIIGVAVFFISMTCQAQQVEPGVGLRGLLEVGKLHKPQIKAFIQRYHASPSDYGIEVADTEGVLTEIKFKHPRFSTKIQGSSISINDNWPVSDTARSGKLQYPNLGIELIENNQRVDAIVVYPPLH